MMDRRDFISVLGGSLVIAPSVTRAQPAGGRFTIGFLGLSTPAAAGTLLKAFEERLRDLGYVEGRNIAFERRWAHGMPDKLPALAAELVRLRVDVIVASVNSTIAALKGATAAIPIVMVHPANPVEAGFVASLARPGGNITGLSLDASIETQGKLLQLLKEIVPGLSRVAILQALPPDSTQQIEATEAAARKLGLSLDVVGTRSLDDLDNALATIAGKRPGALLIDGSPLTFMRRQQIAAFAIEHQLLGIHSLKEYARAGLVLAYGPELVDLYRRAAAFVDKILKGAKPADLPVEQPTKFELVINLKTARALGITIPRSLLLRADEVIQ